MTYTLNHKLAEANAMFLICEAIRKILLKEFEEGKPRAELIEKLVSFYRVTSPRMAQVMDETTEEHREAHLIAAIGSHIYIHLSVDEYIDFLAVRKYLKETWPMVNDEVFEKPKRGLSWISVSGKEVMIDPSTGLLLEKTGPDWTQKSSAILQEMLKAGGGAENDQVIDRSIDTQAALYRYYTALVDMCERNEILIGMEWLRFETFRAWAMENGYKVGLRLERKILTLGYVPGNVSWQERRFRSRELDPQTHDRVEMDDYLKSRGIVDTDVSKLLDAGVAETGGYLTDPKPMLVDKKGE